MVKLWITSIFLMVLLGQGSSSNRKDRVDLYSEEGQALIAFVKESYGIEEPDVLQAVFSSIAVEDSVTGTSNGEDSLEYTLYFSLPNGDSCEIELTANEQETPKYTTKRIDCWA